MCVCVHTRSCVCDGVAVIGCIRGHGCLTSRPSVSGLAQNRFFKAMPELSCGPERETERDAKTIKTSRYLWSPSVRYSNYVPSVCRPYPTGCI